MTDKAEPPIAILSSGHSIIIEEVKLFPETEVAKLASLRAEAARLLGGTSSGIGFIGSPAWAIGGSIAVGFLEGLANNSMKKQATALLQEAMALHASLVDDGRFFSFTDIAGMATPTPQGWSSAVTDNVTVKIDRRVVSGGMFGRIVADGEERIEQRTTRFIHFDQEFTQVRNTSGLIHVKWADVSAYRAGSSPKNAPAKPPEFLTTAELAAQQRRPFTDPSYKSSG